MLKKLILLTVPLMTLNANAEQLRASIQVGGDYLFYGPTCKLEKSEHPRTQINGSLTFFPVSTGEEIVIKTTQLESGNCTRFAALNFPEALQLVEGELVEIPLQPKGASAIGGSKQTVFYARFDRPAKNVIRVYGGCTWNYRCGGSGNSDVTITTVP